MSDSINLHDATLQDIAQQRPDIVRKIARAPDFDTLLAQYMPRDGESYEWEDFAIRGIELIEGTRHRFLVLGHVALDGWPRFFPHLSQRQFELEAARAWDCSRSTVNKAMTLAKSPVAIPEDCSTTLAYTILSAAAGDASLANLILDRALVGGWSSFDVNNIKTLINEGLLTDWVRPHLYRSGEYLCIQVGEDVARFARVKGENNLQKAGARLLAIKGGF